MPLMQFNIDLNKQQTQSLSKERNNEEGTA